MNRIAYLLTLLGVSAFAVNHPEAAIAITFGSGGNQFDIDFVTIGNAGNAPDTTGNPNPAGSVPYEFQIGKYEVSREMITKANAAGGLGITLNAMAIVDGGARPGMPAAGVSWFESAKFVNWLNTSSGYSPAYKFDASGIFQLWNAADPGFNPANLFRNSLARYVLPSTNEWYKAAYFDPTRNQYFDYPTGSNAAPQCVARGTASGTAVCGQFLTTGPADIMQAGGLSPNGTIAQGGNIEEWEESEFDLVNNIPMGLRGSRGVDWVPPALFLTSSIRGGVSPAQEAIFNGFRVASVPEPYPSLLIFPIVLAILSIRKSSIDLGIVVVARTASNDPF